MDALEPDILSSSALEAFAPHSASSSDSVSSLSHEKLHLRAKSERETFFQKTQRFLNKLSVKIDVQ